MKVQVHGRHYSELQKMSVTSDNPDVVEITEVNYDKVKFNVTAIVKKPLNSTVNRIISTSAILLNF
jgi:hypothetical protein